MNNNPAPTTATIANYQAPFIISSYIIRPGHHLILGYREGYSQAAWSYLSALILSSFAGLNSNTKIPQPAIMSFSLSIICSQIIITQYLLPRPPTRFISISIFLSVFAALEHLALNNNTTSNSRPNHIQQLIGIILYCFAILLSLASNHYAQKKLRSNVVTSTDSNAAFEYGCILGYRSNTAIIILISIATIELGMTFSITSKKTMQGLYTFFVSYIIYHIASLTLKKQAYQKKVAAVIVLITTSYFFKQLQPGNISQLNVAGFLFLTTIAPSILGSISPLMIRDYDDINNYDHAHTINVNEQSPSSIAQISAIV